MGDSRTIRVAALQPALRWLGVMPNLHLLRQTCEQLVQRASLDWIVLPESFNGQPCEYDNGAAGRDARTFLATLARACEVNVVGGSIEYQHDDGTRRNTCFVLDRDGNEIGRYDKRVLFNREPELRTAGREAGTFEVEGVRVAVLICADLWDPALARELVGRADVVFVPAKTTVPSDRYVEYARAVWWNLALTRSVENMMPVVVSDWAANRHEAKRLVDGTTIRDLNYTSGGASLCDPSHRPDIDRMQQTIVRGAEGVLLAEIDLDAVARVREYRQSVGLLPREKA
jgi:predicted amidohydrolase